MFCPVCRQEMEKRTDDDDEWWECPSHCDTEIAIDEMVATDEDREDKADDTL